MKRGFLNTQKAKQRVAEAARSESTGLPQKKSKDKQRYVIIIHAISRYIHILS
ncbi:hypothetical protein M405DRAFT_819530 [Rhizopogon salebrosus TDB-379]|nr:hypothetical protein M405DRAFT_819530 [Rhizopogon salebrosus TDB-379]